MEERFIPELGQMAFGQPCQYYGCSNLMEAALVSISGELERIRCNIHQKVMPNPFGNSGETWECDEFKVEAYSWNDEYNQPYNFKWKDIEVSWYKYIGRGMSQNRQISAEEIGTMLNACLGALKDYGNQNKRY